MSCRNYSVEISKIQMTCQKNICWQVGPVYPTLQCDALPYFYVCKILNLQAETEEILFNRSNSSRKWFEFLPVTPTFKISHEF